MHATVPGCGSGMVWASNQVPYFPTGDSRQAALIHAKLPPPPRGQPHDTANGTRHTPTHPQERLTW